jgi:glutamate/tyrosine decarboxylase-like PLP-dependent enzyme
MSTAPAIDRDAFRQLALAAADLAHGHLHGVPDGPVFAPMTPEERRLLLEQPLPDDGQDPRAILDLFRDAVLPHVMGNGHPRFFGWVNSPPAPVGVLADFLAAAMNPSCAGGDHAAIYVERAAVRWLMELVGFPTAGSMGLLVSGASVATIVALAAARRRITAAHGWDVRTEGMQGAHPRLRVYVTAEGHSCLHKAAELLGLGASAIRTIPHDDDFRMIVPALRDAIAADQRAGDLPCCVAASAGTVGTGAVDPLAEIAAVCAQDGIWFHVDGAYGALGAVSIGQEARYAGMERADSLALDPHKWLSVPVECGCLLVRDGALLRDTFSLVPPYLRTEEGKGFGGLPWFSEYGVQQTRGFRALKLWMVLQHLGRNGVTALIDHHLALAQDLAALVDASPDFERLAPVTLSIVAFRYAPAELRGDEPRLDALNKRVMERIQSEGAAFLTNTSIKGRFALRACILHYGTQETDIAALVDTVRRTGSALAAADASTVPP